MSGSRLTIQKLGPMGDGIHEEGRTRIYVDRTAPGDLIEAQVSKDKDGILRGEVAKLLEPSRFRQEAPCPYYDRCGNCTLQHLTPAFYRNWKSQMVRDAFQKQGLRPRQWLEPVYLGRQRRRRVTFTALKRRNQILLGYYRRRSDQITDIDACLIAEPKILDLRNAIKPFLSAALKDGKSVDIFLQVVGQAVDVVVTGPVVKEALVQLREVPGITRLSWQASEKESIQEVFAKGSVVAAFGTLKVPLPPGAFLQPTQEGEETLVNAVISALPTKGKFADLFSGCGTFSGPMLKLGSVDAFESLPAAVSTLSKAAAAKPLKVFRRDLFRRPLRRDEINRYDAVVFDPPRAGCAAQAEELASSKTRTLVGVSCNPATFARDARILCDGGYWLQSLQLVDQFLWSHHVEVVGVFTRQKRKSP
jgi:23S rRNA (uracil1939-C5)-methyltransferase